jgi:hypothetical protein
MPIAARRQQGGQMQFLVHRKIVGVAVVIYLSHFLFIRKPPDLIANRLIPESRKSVLDVRHVRLDFLLGLLFFRVRQSALPDFRHLE